MNDAIKHEYQVIIEEYSENNFPIQMNILETEDELNRWKNTITNRQINNINEIESKGNEEIIIRNINGEDVVIKISDNFYEKLEKLSIKEKLDINQTLMKYICCYRDIYQTNHNGEIRLHFHKEYLGDLIKMGRVESINAIKIMIEQAINLEHEVVFENHSPCSLPKIHKLFSKEDKVELNNKIEYFRKKAENNKKRRLIKSLGQNPN